MGDYVRNTIGNSLHDSIYAYISSFFNLKKWKYIEHEEYKNPFQPCIDLWKLGLVPSLDKGIWRLHAGMSAKIVYEINAKISAEIEKLI